MSEKILPPNEELYKDAFGDLPSQNIEELYKQAAELKKREKELTAETAQLKAENSMTRTCLDACKAVLSEYVKYFGKEVLSKTSLNDIGLSLRPINCLLRANFRTFGDLMEHNREDVRNARNMNEKAFNEIERVMAELDIRFADDKFVNGPIYIAVHEKGITPRETDMKDLEQLIRDRDGVENPVLACVNDSAELAALLEHTDFYDRRNWPMLKILLIPDEGEICGYTPLRFVENFKKQAKPGKLSYELFCEILGLAH